MSIDKKNHYLLGWFVCGLGALYYAYEYLLRIAPSVMEAPLRHTFGLDAAGFGVLSAVYYYAYVPMQLPVGILMDRYGPRRLLTFACFLCVVGTYLFASTESVYIAGLGRFLVGMGSAFAFVGVLKLATIWLPEDKLALVSGSTAALGTVGAMLGDNVLGQFVDTWGWQSTLMASATFGVALTIALWLFIRDKFQDTQHVPKNDGVESFAVALKDLGLILKNKQIWMNGIFGCFVYLPTTVIAELWGIPYLQHAHHLSKEAAQLGNSILFLGFMVGAPIMGMISDKIHRRRLPMQVGALGALACMLVILYVPGLTQQAIYIIMFILGLFYSSQAIVFAVAREISPHEAGGTAMATTNMIVMLGGMLMQPLVGWLLKVSESMQQGGGLTSALHSKASVFYSASDYRYAMAIIPLGIFIAYIATLFIRETYAVSK